MAVATNDGADNDRMFKGEQPCSMDKPKQKQQPPVVEMIKLSI